jgi:ketosteroid isomerase-like protein
VFERLRFARYALRFERAFKTDRWDAVRACFADDATYTIVGGGPYDGVVRGADEIARFFQRFLNELDHRFDRRLPGLTSFPRVSGGELSVHWRARYVLATESVVLTGHTQCRFRDGLITELRDTMPIEETERTLALRDKAKRSGRSATPS